MGKRCEHRINMSLFPSSPGVKTPSEATEKTKAARRKILYSCAYIMHPHDRRPTQLQRSQIKKRKRYVRRIFSRAPLLSTRYCMAPGVCGVHTMRPTSNSKLQLPRHYAMLPTRYIKPLGFSIDVPFFVQSGWCNLYPCRFRHCMYATA